MQATAGLAARFYDSLSPALRPDPQGRPEAGALGFDAAPAPDRLREAAAGFVQTLREGEKTATAGLAGRADAQSVVTALAASEIAVQTAVTLRDKVVEAYQEILRMPV